MSTPRILAIATVSFLGLACVVKVGFDYFGRPWFRAQKYWQLTEQVGTAYQVDPRLIRALIWRESRFDASCLGKAGEIGLMQVTPAVAVEWAGRTRRDFSDNRALFDPFTNVTIGTWYLSRALKRWETRDDPLPYALAEYNAGLSNVRRWDDASKGGSSAVFIKTISYPGTRAYVQTITRRYRE